MLFNAGKIHVISRRPKNRDWARLASDLNPQQRSRSSGYNDTKSAWPSNSPVSNTSPFIVRFNSSAHQTWLYPFICRQFNYDILGIYSGPYLRQGICLLNSDGTIWSILGASWNSFFGRFLAYTCTCMRLLQEPQLRQCVIEGTGGQVIEGTGGPVI